MSRSCSRYWICGFIILIFGWNAAAATIDYDLEEGIIVDAVQQPSWSGSFASGLNGKSGNSQSLDINMTLKLDRESDISTTAILASYFFANNGIATVTDRAFFQARQERKFVNDKWSWYNQVAVEWDRFKAFDYRIALHSGLAYQFFKDDLHSLKGRFGAGTSREVGGVNDEWLPELQFGGDWERKLTDTTKVFTTVDYYPNVSDFSDYRVNTNAGVNFLIDGERNLNLRLFALNRYDSTPPPGNDKNDIDYGMALVVGF